MMVSEKELEAYDYEKGSIDELKRKVFVLSDYLIIGGEKDKGISIAMDTDKSKSKSRVLTMLRLACKHILNMSGIRWDAVYQALFENSLYSLENHYKPADDKDAEEVVKKCIRDKKRIKSKLPDGAIA